MPLEIKAKKSSGIAAPVIVLLVIGGMGLCGGVALVLGVIYMAANAHGHPPNARAIAAKDKERLQNIGTALRQYQQLFETLPPAYVPDGNGQRRTSWRALILPYVSQLLHSYNYDVAWDARENWENRRAHMPEYLPYPTTYPEGALITTFAAITGPGTAFPGGSAVALNEIRDDASKTILVVKIKNSNIEWSEPRDLPIDSLTTDPNAANSIDLKGGALALLADGTVVRLPTDMTLEQLKQYVSIAGGETLPPID